MDTTIKLYESMQAVSTEMVAAARANDWDRLVELEHRMSATRDEIARTDSAARIADSELLRRAELIANILENNREVRRHVDPWMASTRKLLGSGERDRAVRAAYGASSR